MAVVVLMNCGYVFGYQCYEIVSRVEGVSLYRIVHTRLSELIPNIDTGGRSYKGAAIEGFYAS
jgi:hypothetical protein